ncbi:GFA family protein [Photobacterium sp. DNB22_13_2]
MKGKCLCGAIELTAEDQKEVGLCHCNMCRKWSGGPLFAVHCNDVVTIEGDAPVVYRSSEWAERVFCGTCGTHLFYHLLPSNEYIVSAGLFQEQAFTLTSEIFIDEKPDFYELKNDTHKMTAQQVFEQYTPKDV